MGLGKLKKALKTGMGGSRGGKGRSEGTETMKEYSDKLRRAADKSEIEREDLVSAIEEGAIAFPPTSDWVPAWGPKKIDFRECACGSGAHWANCMESSPYCG